MLNYIKEPRFPSNCNTWCYCGVISSGALWYREGNNRPVQVVNKRYCAWSHPVRQ